MNDINSENLQKQLELFIHKKNYRQAYKVWQELKDLQDQGVAVTVDLTDLLRHITRTASSERQDLIATLEALFAPGIDLLDRDLGFDTEALLEALYASSTSDDERDYQRLKRRFETLKSEQEQRLEYERTRAIVQDYWEQAERAISENVTIAVENLLVFYDKALNEARVAAESSPQNPLLEQLKLQAASIRDRFATEEEIMTSAGQTEDFVRVLKHVANLQNSDTVMVYDNAGVPIARMNAQDARATIIENAKAYVQSKVSTYAQAAKDALGDDNPREAQSWLERYQKFIDLDVYTNGENILVARQKNDYNTLLRQTSDSLERLNTAESSAKNAADEAEKDAFRAWPIYVQALKQHPGAARSNGVLQASERITTATRSQLNQHFEVIKVQIGTLDFAGALKGIEALENKLIPVWETLNLKEGLSERAQVFLKQASASLNAERIALETYRKQAQKGLADKATINKELRSIETLGEREPHKAKAQLDALLEKFDPALVEADVLYSTVSSRVMLSVDADSLLKDFTEYLSSNNLTDVRKKYEEAQEASNRVTDKTYNRRFSEIAVQLGFKVHLLEAEALLMREGYAKTIDVYQSVLREPDLGTKVRELATTRLSFLRKESAQTENNKNLLSAAETALSKEGFDVVWSHLSKIDRFSDEAQTQSWLNLLHRSLELVRINVPFDLTHYNAILALARAYNTESAAYFEKQTRKYVHAQNARDAKQRGDLDESLRLWKEGIDKGYVGGNDADYFIGQISILEEIILEANQERYMRALKDAVSNNSQDMNSVLADIQRLLKDLRLRASEASSSEERLKYAVWSAQAELAYALNHPNPATRHTTLNTLGEQASTIEKKIQEYEGESSRGQSQYTLRNNGSNRNDQLVANAQRVLVWVRKAQQVSMTLREIEMYVLNSKDDLDIAIFESAVNGWNTLFSDAALSDGYRTLLDWYDREVKAVRSALATQFNSAQPTEIKFLSTGARLLTLNPRDPDGQKLLLRLRDLDGVLNRDFTSHINSLPNDLVHTVYEQVEALKERLAYLDLMIRVLRMPYAQRAAQENETLVRLVNGQRNLLGQIVTQFERFDKVISDFDIKINDYSLDNDNWAQAQENLQQQYSNLQTKVQEIGKAVAKLLQMQEFGGYSFNVDGFERLHLEHNSVITADAKQRDTIKIVKTVVEVCSALKDAVENDRFDDAITIISNAETRRAKNQDVKKVWDISTLQDDLSIVASEDGRTYRGWETIKTFAETRAKRLQRVINWAQNTAKAIGWDNINHPQLKADWPSQSLQSHKVLMALYAQSDLSQAVKFQLEALIAEGRFRRAEQLLEMVLYGNSGSLGGYSSLSDIRTHFTQYPLADSDATFTDDLQQALRAAGSQAAKNVLQQMIQTTTHYQRAFREAETMLKALPDYRNRWSNLTQQATEKLRAISEVTAHHQQVTGREANHLRNLCEDYKLHIAEMRREFPYHPDIKSYEEHPEIIRASRLTI